jgi:hypothetical protein
MKSIKIWHNSEYDVWDYMTFFLSSGHSHIGSYFVDKYHSKNKLQIRYVALSI